MKTAIILALCFSSFILTGRAADALTLTVTDSDTSKTGNFPLSSSVNGATAVSSTSSPASITSTFGTTAASNTIALTYTAGVPLVSTYALASTTTAGGTTAGAATDYVIVKLSVGDRVVALSGGDADAEAETSASALGSTSVCGDSYTDYMAGTVSFVVLAAANAACTITVTQEYGVIGVIQYSDSSLTSAQTTAIQSSLQSTASNAVSGATAVLTAQGTGSTLQYYLIDGLTSSTQTSNVQSAIQAAIYAKTISSSGATQLNGYAKTVNPSASATTAAPSSSVAANILAAYPKSHSRMVAVVGVFTTVAAAFFGLAF